MQNDELIFEKINEWIEFLFYCKNIISKKIIHIKGQHNCLADYLSRHPVQNDEEIFDEDYGISMLFQGKPPETVHTPVNHPPVIGAIVTRSKMKQIKQQQNENDKIKPPTVNDIPSSSSKDKIEHSNKSPSHLITSSNFDITQIKLEQSKDSNIQKKIKEIMQDPTKHPYVVTDDLLYKLVYHNNPLSGHFGIQRTYLNN